MVKIGLKQEKEEEGIVSGCVVRQWSDRVGNE